MTFTFRPAKRENVSLLIGLAGGTGSGKTYSAMSMAAGICGDQPFAVIDTENGRASHYADAFRFDVGELREPFNPNAYAEAIIAADRAGYKCIVVDSMSHEWAGYGGVLDMQEAELDRMAGDNWSKREACKMAAWIKPKSEHKHMVQRLLQVKANLILCFRAEEKIEVVKVNGKLEMRPKQSLTGLDGWIPICEKNLPFELTVSFLLTPDRPGYPKPIKLQEQHKTLFPLDRPINAESGRLVSAWAAGTVASPPPAAPPPSTKQRKPFDVKTVLSQFDLFGVTQEHLVARLGHAISEGDREQLLGWRQALVDGQPWPDADERGGALRGDPSGEAAGAAS